MKEQKVYLIPENLEDLNKRNIDLMSEFLPEIDIYSTELFF